MRWCASGRSRRWAPMRLAGTSSPLFLLNVLKTVETRCGIATRIYSSTSKQPLQNILYSGTYEVDTDEAHCREAQMHELCCQSCVAQGPPLFQFQ